MSSKKEPTVKETTKPRKRPEQVNAHTAAEKAQAVLAVWTERVKPATVMHSLGISYVVLQQWQDRAMEEMLQALESRVNLAKGEVLSPRLQTLLQKRTAQPRKLSQRLDQSSGRSRVDHLKQRSGVTSVTVNCIKSGQVALNF